MTWPTAVTLIAALIAIIVPLLAFIRSGKADKVSRVDQLEKRMRALEDYCYLLRRNIEQAGGEVPPWPEALAGHGE